MPEKIAIVHEWVSSRAGSEKVFEALAQMYPDADLYALSQEPGVEMDYGGREVKTTFLDKAAFRNRRSLTLPLMPLAWQLIGQHKYDLVISSHHAFAASNRLAKRDGRHLAYVYTPARYVWTPELDGRGTSALLKPVRAFLKAIDRSYVARITQLAGLSEEVVARIGKYWNRDAVVIAPPADTEYFVPGIDLSIELDLPEGFILGFGRWIPYKNMATVIEVGEATGKPVVVTGRGPEKARLLDLASRATVPVKVIESPSQEEVRELYRRADALIFPTFDDFGLVPVEAMACGTPVVALNRGGAADTVLDGESGALVQEHSAASYAEGVSRALNADPKACRARAEEFSHSEFARKIQAWASNAEHE